MIAGRNKQRKEEVTKYTALQLIVPCNTTLLFCLLSVTADRTVLLRFLLFSQISRCVKFQESNDKSQLIFGSVTNIQAKDAAPVEVCIFV